MRFSYIIFAIGSIVGWSLVFVVDSDVAAAEVSGKDLLKRVIDKRLKIISGTFEAKCSTSGGTERSHDILVRFREGALRVETTEEEPSRRIIATHKAIRHDGELTWHLALPPERKANLAVIIDDATHPKSTAAEGALFDPRVVGLTPSEYAHWPSRSTFYEALTPDEARPIKVTTVDEGDKTKLVKLDYELKSGSSVTTWVDPEQLFVSRMECRMSRQQVQREEIFDALECTQDRSNDLAFSSAITWRRSINGKVLVEQKIVLRNCRLNVKIDEGEFALESLKLPKGTVIIRETKGGLGTYWDGNGEVAGFPQAMAEPDIKRRGVSSWWITSACLFLASMLFLAYWAFPATIRRWLPF